MATSDSLIQVRNLKKHYHRGAIKALDGGKMVQMLIIERQIYRHGREDS